MSNTTYKQQEAAIGMLLTQRILSVGDGVLGPAYRHPEADRYGWHRITVKTIIGGKEVSTSIYSDALGECYVEWDGYKTEMGQDEAEEFFQLRTGMSPGQAERYYYCNWEPDPMGSLSMYA